MLISFSCLSAMDKISKEYLNQNSFYNLKVKWSLYLKTAWSVIQI